MPACFQLSLKDEPTFIPMSLTNIDEQMCHHFLTSVHPTKYYVDWVDHIGFRLACGKTFDDLKSEAATEPDGYLAQLLPIIEWLDEKYTSRCFHQTKY